MSEEVHDIVDQAVAWHVRLASASVDEWHGFVDWLEADAAHGQAYDRIEMEDRLLPAAPVPTPALIAANDVRPPRRIARWAAAGGGLGLAALCAILLIGVDTPADSTYSVQTAPGETRTIKLSDDTLIEMNGGTRLTLKRGDDRYAVLDSGEATFHVRHDPIHPFELASGRFAIRDLGTVFNVTRDGPRLGVDVAEGSLLFDPGRQSVKLGAGMGLSVGDEQLQPVMHQVHPKSVGGWRRGLLDFRETQVGAAARAISRSTGATILVGDPLSARRFTGTIHLTDRPEVVIPRFAALVGADWKHDKGSWMLTPRSDEEQ